MNKDIPPDVVNAYTPLPEDSHDCVIIEELPIDNITKNKTNLLLKLENHINTDLNQIHSVYDSKIKDSLLQKNLEIEEINRKYDALLASINTDRDHEIVKYNKKAEQRISNLIINLHKPTDNKYSWWLNWLL